MTIEERLDRIERKLDLILEQTAPPPSLKTKMRARNIAKKILNEKQEKGRSGKKDA